MKIQSTKPESQGVEQDNSVTPSNEVAMDAGFSLLLQLLNENPIKPEKNQLETTLSAGSADDTNELLSPSQGNTAALNSILLDLQSKLLNDSTTQSAEDRNAAMLQRLDVNQLNERDLLPKQMQQSTTEMPQLDVNQLNERDLLPKQMQQSATEMLAKNANIINDVATQINQLNMTANAKNPSMAKEIASEVIIN